MVAAVKPTEGLCISTVSRLAVNTKAGLTYCQDIQDQLRGLHDDNIDLYDSESLHLSLVGCTQRVTIDSFRRNHFKRIDLTIRSLIYDCLNNSPTFQVGGLNIVSGQFFIEVLPVATSWSDTRNKLTQALRSIDEDPITYTDTEPVHLNIGRLKTDVPTTKRQKNIFEQLHSQQGPLITVKNIELLQTDFTLTPSIVKLFATYSK